MMTKPRCTVRRLMVVVAIVALAFGGWGAFVRYRAIVTLSDGYRRQAIYYSAFASLSEGEAFEFDAVAAAKKKPPDRYPGWTWEALANGGARERRLGNYYRTLAKKYEQAARYPWLPVDPDPPYPQ